MRKIVLFLMAVTSIAVQAVPAPGLQPKIAEEGQKATLFWQWGNGECSIQGIPGFTKKNGFPDFKSDGALQTTEITVKPEAAGKYEIAPRQICRVNNGGAIVTENMPLGEPLVIRPTMFLCYPAIKGKPCPENKGIYWGDVWRFEFTSKNADSCEMSDPPNLHWELMQYKDYYLITNMARGGTGSKWLTWKFRCKNPAGTFEYEKSVLFNENTSPIDKSVTIRTFAHGNYEFGKTNLYWTTENAKECSMSRSDGVTAKNIATGSVGYLVDIGYKYTLACSASNGSKASQTIDVPFTSPDVFIESFYANNFRSKDYKADLHWATKNAQSCDLKGSNGFSDNNVGVSGFVGYPVKSDATYTLTCKGYTNRTASKSVFVPVSGSGECFHCPPIEVESANSTVVLSAESKEYEYAQNVVDEFNEYKVVNSQDGFTIYKKDEYDRYILHKEVFFQEGDNLIRSINMVDLK